MKRQIKHLLAVIFPKIKNIRTRTTVLKLILRLDDPLLSTARDLMKKHYNIEIGKHSYGCFKLDYSVEPGTTIGSFCSVAPGVRIGSMNHPYHFVTTHPFLYDKSYGFVSENKDDVIREGSKSVTLEDDVWVGLNAIVLPGVTIGKGAIVGAGSVVTKDVPPYSIVGGVPAKVIKKRFSSEIIKELLEIDWTSWEEDKIKSKLDSFYNIDEFINKNRHG